MKLKIKIYAEKNTCMPHIIKKGEWVDLTNAESVKLKSGIEPVKLSLGVVMQIPKGFEAWILPRSSTYQKYKITIANGMGIIDHSYCGKDDVCKLLVRVNKDVFIPEGVRIAQFRITLSQKANIWQKLKWLFASGIKLVPMEKVEEPSRGGFGSTGEK